ncbi:MAG: hypothetical protein HeimC2_21300 [Candidatus Heimdallarchaeota archaeon LC_2]|nr:MAG: hypothetical protein HeimC2_21300 [Candidatus Heimdallarchaeota archaeon LC_2]
MKRKNQLITSVKIGIDNEKLSKSTRQRLRQIMGRDTRIIKKYLHIIECHKYDLVSKIELKRTKKSKKGSNVNNEKKFRFTIDKGKLDLLTATTEHRPIVPHDFKAYFPRISLNEMKECRDTACGIYLGHLESKSKQENSGKPNINKPLPRSIGYRRFKLNIDSYIVSLMDSMDSNLGINSNNHKKIRHQYLDLPLKISSYHRTQLQKGDIKSLRIKRVKQKYLAIFSIKQTRFSGEHLANKKNLPIAVLGIDLGIKQDVAISVLTKYGIVQQQFITSNLIRNTKKSLTKLERRYSNIKNSIAKDKSNSNNDVDGKLKLIRDIGNKRSRLKFEINHQLTAELIYFIKYVAVYFDLYIGLGKLKGIRKSAIKGKATKNHRKRIHRWAYSQFTDLLEYKLHKIRPIIRFAKVSEAYTSQTCWKCAQRGNRPKQDYFVCRNSSCGWRGHADFNGATNIAKRAASYFDLTPNLKPFFMTNGESGLSPVST